MDTLILSRDYIRGRAQAIDYIRAVEAAFHALATGEMQSLPVGHIPARDGGIHIKAARSETGTQRAVIKINGNFPDNPRLRTLPTIQGCIVLTNVVDGRLLAVMDTIEITAQRTAAASAVAARHLARRDSATMALIGCGVQAEYHLPALLALDAFPIRSLRCFDLDRARAEQLCSIGKSRGLDSTIAASSADACRGADIVVSCTPSRQPFIGSADIKAGAFIAAVGADNPSKCEIEPALMARSFVVPDIAAQASAMGDLRAAIAAGTMRLSDVHAELAEVVSGRRPGRLRDEDIIVFDSTGTAIEDLAATEMIYQLAMDDPEAMRVGLNLTTAHTLAR